MDVFDDIDHAIKVRKVNAIHDRNPRVFRNRIDRFEIYNDCEFRQRYRLSKECTRFVISLVEERLSSVSVRKNILTPTLQIFIALCYYAKGCYQVELEDLHGISQPTVSKVVASTFHWQNCMVYDAERHILDIFHQRDSKSLLDVCIISYRHLLDIHSSAFLPSIRYLLDVFIDVTWTFIIDFSTKIKN
ncbi:hypothetical protein ACFW04_013773 [Cataglyphis niger]